MFLTAPTCNDALVPLTRALWFVEKVINNEMEVKHRKETQVHHLKSVFQMAGYNSVALAIFKRKKYI